MNVAIVGGRNFNNYGLMKEVIDRLLKAGMIKDVNLIISGGAKGADTLGIKYANDHGYAWKLHLPNWDKYGKAAGFIRNKEIVEDSDFIIAFWDGESLGTKSTIELALKKVPVHISYY